MHMNPFGLLGGDLRGALPNPTIAPDGAAALGDILYADAAGRWRRLPGNTTTEVQALLQTGTGAASAVPFWWPFPFGKGVTANQATFVNVATNITSLSFPVRAGESWNGSFIVIFTTAVAATGCQFAFTVPAGATGSMAISGNTTAVTATTLYNSTAITTLSTTFFGTATGITARVQIDLVLVNPTNAGTVQLQGKSGGATTTIQINPGTQFLVQRFA